MTEKSPPPTPESSEESVPESVSLTERTTANELLNAFEKAVCIIHEANLEAGETEDEFDYDSAKERYDDTRQALKDALTKAEKS